MNEPDGEVERTKAMAKAIEEEKRRAMEQDTAKLKEALADILTHAIAEVEGDESDHRIGTS